MTTPTPGKHNSQVGATPPVSTPFSTSHLAAFSPRGAKTHIPSPQQVKKSPANSHTVYGHHSNSSFGGINFDSPSAAAALGVMPGLGDIPLDGSAGGPGTGLQSLHGIGRGDEDEQRRRLVQVVEMLKANKGHVSEQGLERLAKRVGLESMWDAKMGSTGNTGTLIIAGNGVALDIDLEDDVVTRVALSFPEASKIVSSHADKAGRIFLRDLQIGPGESVFTKTLDRFANNLERLATLDKLSVPPNLSCHEAVSGIYESLRRLYDFEISEIKSNPVVNGQRVRSVENYVLSKKSGRPGMHVGDQVGLSLEYWCNALTKSRADDIDRLGSWSIVVECAPLSNIVFPPLRVSDKWISSSIRKEASAEQMLLGSESSIIDWLEPENTLLPTESKSANAMEGIEQSNGMGNTKFPEVMFVAKFVPELVLPYAVAANIYSLIDAPFESFAQLTYDALLIKPTPDEKYEPGEPRTVPRIVRVKDREGAIFVERELKCTLFVDKVDYGYKLAKMPFSHPRQLIEILPVLRQYALMSKLLQSCFGPNSQPPKAKTANSGPAINKKDGFAAFMGGASESDLGDRVSIDVSIAATPLPRLQILFPMKTQTASVIFEIRPNGIVSVISQTILPVDGNSNPSKIKSPEDLARLLELCEDIGVFVTYLRGNFT